MGIIEVVVIICALDWCGSGLRTAEIGAKSVEEEKMAVVEMRQRVVVNDVRLMVGGTAGVRELIGVG